MLDIEGSSKISIKRDAGGGVLIPPHFVRGSLENDTEKKIVRDLQQYYFV